MTELVESFDLSDVELEAELIHLARSGQIQGELGRRTARIGSHVGPKPSTEAGQLQVDPLLRNVVYPLRWALEPDAACPQVGDVVPLWERHDAIVGVMVEGPEHRFLTYSIYAPEEYEVLGSSIQNVLADLLFWMWTEHELSDEQILKLSGALGFSSGGWLLNQLKTALADGGLALLRERLRALSASEFGVY